MTAYGDIRAENYSSLKTILTSPHAYRYNADHPRTDRDAWRVGRAVHTAVLEPEKYADEYAVWHENRRGKAWEEFQELHEDCLGKTILTAAQHATARAIADAVRAHPAALALLSEEGGRAEVELQWTHSRTGEPLKGRLDWLCSSALVDLKTCRDPGPRRFASAAARLHYPMQLAMYAAGLRANGHKHRPVKIIAAQNQPPFDVVVYDVPHDALAMGDRLCDAALNLLLTCRETNTWPGISAAEMELRLPPWADPDYDEDAADWEVAIAGS